MPIVVPNVLTVPRLGGGRSPVNTASIRRGTEGDPPQQFFTTFGTTVPPTQPTGWNFFLSNVIGDTTPVTEDLGGDQAVTLKIPGGSTNAARLGHWADVAGSTEDIELTALCRQNESDERIGLLAARASTDTGQGYYVRVGLLNLQIRRRTGTADGDHVLVAEGLHALTSTTDAWLWIRFRLNGTSLKAKVWAHGGSEPALWTVEATDANWTIGLFGWLTRRGSRQDWARFGVGLNGFTAPTA
jgi:hypothetical protein